MKTEILKALRESKDYISGQQLCEQFGVSRTAVWKAIRKLEEEGYVIEAVRNKGYRLIDYPEKISQEELGSLMNTQWAGKSVKFYDEVDSTNTTAKQLAEEGAIHGTLVVADKQNSGRGRRGRTWESPSGTGIWMSVILKPDIIPANASMLTLVMALSVLKACREVTGLEGEIKWPNDLVIHKKKVCGILTEMSAQIDYINHIVVGVGINVNTDYFPEVISKMATSLKLEGNQSYNRARLIVKVMECFETYYDKFMETEDMSLLQDEYDSHLINLNQEVKVTQQEGEYFGVSEGITSRGELIIRQQDGTKVLVYAGEVSVRGLYGYV
ncbi:biotin--[acetyl-CoA-carboxylase] ligase [Anaerosacchariphilus polymeriproducens]|uniref:Bifunctional ligase/repressor BirA n=1 Tax=Anaerosacchariphilus polymeriproducens TaxID=1812858 RepID=A0A371AXE4_9FIRM|nr:biotin--[acetyl-CoA-carboxylase] ligase [Anaerosacchariphilus polymeriproducens]RDU24245.1 biotin--[acetyl-CoA-carboxylase] ligase [Anaerosacchariphilus polymeriproducens]